jgi:hypothetical protein
VKTDELLSAVMALPSAERAKIAHSLIRSLDDLPEDEEAVALDWAPELMRRSLDASTNPENLADWNTVREEALARCRAR